MPTVTRRPVPFMLIALALLLAPFGICLNGGPAMAAPGHGAAMHHEPAAPASHHGQAGHGKLHHCTDCQPPSFVKAGKVAVPDVVLPGVGIAPLLLAQPLRYGGARAAWARGTAVRAPPVRRSYRIRLQI